MTPESTPVDFLFIRPLWLIGLLILPALGWAFGRWVSSSGWEAYIDSEKLKYLSIVTPAERSWMRPILLAALALACLALAGPSWRSMPMPVKQTRDAMVIAFDLSPSMLATDLNPDRLTRARLKIIDLLRLRKEGETALIAYADDAYRVSPLTDDASTIEALVPSLHPTIMPAPGSRVEAAAEMATELFAGAAIEQGVLLIVTDGIAPAAIESLEAQLGDSIQLCILGVGGIEGVPIPMPGGGFARDAKGQTVLAGLNRAEIQSLANRHGGCFADLRADDSDLERILERLGPGVGEELDETETETRFDVRQDEGYWLVLFLLPVAALGFRKNILWIGLLFFQASMIHPPTSRAVEWADLWQRSDQRTVQQIEGGIDRYRAGDYEGAAEDFTGDSSLQNYNRGNALALAGQLEEALASYDRVLAEEPDHENARINREVIEELLDQQEQQEQQEQEGEGSPENGEPQDSESESQNSDDESQSESGESQNDPSDSQDSKASQEASESPPDDSDPENAESDPEDQTGEPENAEEEAANASRPEEEPSDSDPEAEASASASPEETTPTPLSDQSEQWLRSIPEDPGGLMRRKFEYQAGQRRQRGTRQPSDNRY